MRKKAAEDKRCHRRQKKANHRTKCGSWKDKGRNRKRLESLTEHRQTKMGCGSQNGSKWTMGISGCCSEACWFEAWSGMGPERKARARRLWKQRVTWELGKQFLRRGLDAASQTGCNKVKSA